ncbi:MAG TPA: hypothetical protein VE173_11435, partial [Longimicrobiales bacterium]|nr:hypothetical protein [Longimicrobiales bacterium]
MTGPGTVRAEGSGSGCGVSTLKDLARDYFESPERQDAQDAIGEIQHACVVASGFAPAVADNAWYV